MAVASAGGWSPSVLNFSIAAKKLGGGAHDGGAAARLVVPATADGAAVDATGAAVAAAAVGFGAACSSDLISACGAAAIIGEGPIPPTVGVSDLDVACDVS